MSRYFQFGDIVSREFGVFLTGMRIADSPKRDVSFLSVPGRNGDLIVDNHRWHNIDVTYECAMGEGFMRGSFDDLKTALLSQSGYQMLRDFVSDYYRLAIVKQPIAPKILQRKQGGTFDITFHCKPQRFLNDGNDPVQFKSPGKILNRFGFPADPIITVHGAGPGSVTIGGTTVVIKEMTDQLTLDCENQNAYRHSGDGSIENMNGKIYAPRFPVLPVGNIPISWDGGVTDVEIIPRWWIL